MQATQYERKITMNNFLIPLNETNYYCRGVEMPTDQIHYVIKMDPILSNET